MKALLWFKAFLMKTEAPQSSPIPYHQDKVYYVKAFKVNNGIVDHINVSYMAYKNGVSLGYGFTPKIELWAV